MAKLAPRKKGDKEVPANAKLESLELQVGPRSYEVYAYFEASDGGWDLELKVGKQTDLGKAITAMVNKAKVHPNRKVK